MRSRWNLRGPGSSLLPSLATLTLSWNALAQDAAPVDPAPAPPAEAAPAAPAPEEEDEDEEGAASAAPAAAEAEAEATAEAEGSASVSVAVEPPPPAKDAGSTDSVSVVILPGSGYPEPKIRGLVGGSLWSIMPGYQFPYMPKVAGQTGVQLGISGSLWNDLSYAKFESGTPETEPNKNRWVNQTRGVLRVTPVYSTEDDWFVQGNVELVAQGDQIANTADLGLVDDLFVRAGKWNLFDITAGRFQAWEIYHYGMALDQNTFERRGAESPRVAAPQIYGVDYFWNRPTGGSGNYALHAYPTDFLRFELLAQFGARVGDNIYGYRGAGILDLGYLKVKAGAEWGTTKPQTEGAKGRNWWNGFGGSIQGIFDPYVEGGLNAAVGYTDVENIQGLPERASSRTTRSFGGFLNVHPPLGSLLIGFGYNVTFQESLDVNLVYDDPRFGDANQHTHKQAFFAIQYGFWDRLFLKFVGANASYDFEDNIQNPPHPFTNEMMSGRFRVQYNF